MPASVPVAANDISDRYLKKAIAETNELGAELARAAGADRAPVLGSGHPQADVFLLKHSPSASEVEEGVAFYGRSGGALMKSFKRLGIDPLTVYGTLCVKCPVGDPDQAAEECVARLALPLRGPNRAQDRERFFSRSGKCCELLIRRLLDVRPFRRPTVRLNG